MRSFPINRLFRNRSRRYRLRAVFFLLVPTLLFLGCLRVSEVAEYPFTVDNVSRMSFLRAQLHQSVFPVLFIHSKSQPYQNRCRNHTKTDADPLVNSHHIHNDKYHEDNKQPCGEDKEVLRFQPLELHTAPHTFVNFIFSHNDQVKGKMNAK